MSEAAGTVCVAQINCTQPSLRLLESAPVDVGTMLKPALLTTPAVSKAEM